MRLKIDADALAEMGNMAEGPADMEAPAPPKKKKGPVPRWHPSLTPTQKKIFDCPALHVLAHGEKGSGKTIGLIHKMVRHCYENRDAFALIMVKVKSMALKGGVWEKLIRDVLPQWQKGLQLEISKVMHDSQHNEYIYVENRFGGWSVICLTSCPFGNQVRERIRGFEPSFVLVDELTSCDTNDYLVAVSAQIGRRQGIDGVQQYTAACNPEGPSHWVYKEFFEVPFDPVTGKWDEDYKTFHVPIGENKDNLAKGYVEKLQKLYRSDPVEAARMLRGEWIDRPSGEALFADIFIPGIHIKPAAQSKQRIIPDPRSPMILGIDPGGSTNNSFIFMQWMPIDEAMRWIVFDEMVYTNRRLRYSKLIPAVLRRIAFWNNYVGKKFRVVYNGDKAAFNQYRANTGSFDFAEFEKLANQRPPGGGQSLAASLGLQPMRMTPAPKFNGSVAQRVRLTMDALSEETLLISAGCPKIIEMFNKLEREEQKPGNYDAEAGLSPKRSQHLHPFDAMTYPILTAQQTPQLLSPPPPIKQEFN